MKALVVYDSTYGNTEIIARAVSDAIGGELKQVKEADPRDARDVDVLIVGSPTQGGRPTPAIKEFLGSIPAAGLRETVVAAFDTRISAADKGFFLRLLINTFGYAAARIAGQLRSKGGRLAGPAGGFLVLGKEGPLQQGEVERAGAWARQVIESLVIKR